MKIKLIDFGLKKDHFPFRPHAKDAGADAFMPYDHTLNPGEIIRIPLGFGLSFRTDLQDMCFREVAWQPKAWYANFCQSLPDIAEKSMPLSAT